MPIRLQLLLFGVIGNVLVAAIFIFSFGYRENIQEDSSNESLLTLYESAWYQTYNKSFDVMSKWLPVSGENASFWDPDSEIFLDEVEGRVKSYKDEEEMRKAAADFMLSSTKPKYCYNFSWQSRPIIQYPQDMVAMQEIIWTVKPD